MKHYKVLFAHRIHFLLKDQLLHYGVRDFKGKSTAILQECWLQCKGKVKKMVFCKCVWNLVGMRF